METNADAAASADGSGNAAPGTVSLGLVVARFHREITERMAELARERAGDLGAEVVASVEVPGAYDAPLAADRLARREDVDAVVAVGAIHEGDTDHDEVVGHAAARGLTEVAIERDLPVTLGITGPGMSMDEARAREEYGASAVESAVDMVEELPG